MDSQTLSKLTLGVLFYSKKKQKKQTFTDDHLSRCIHQIQSSHNPKPPITLPLILENIYL